MSTKKQLSLTEIQNRLHRILSVKDKKEALEDVADLLRDISPAPKPLTFAGKPMTVVEYDDGIAYEYDFTGGDLRVTTKGEVYLGVYLAPYETITVHGNNEHIEHPRQGAPKQSLDRFVASIPKVLKALQTVLDQSKVK